MVWTKLTVAYGIGWWFGLVSVSDGVSVPTVVDPVTATDTDHMVTLPCDFTTDTYETPQITWYKEGEERRRVMMFDIRNRLTSYGEFLNRVARGNKGALVLFRPTARDSGNYSCEIEVDKEVPAWVKGTVFLNVTTAPVTKSTTVEQPSSPPPVSDEQASNSNLVLATVVFWLCPVVCAFVLGRRNFFTKNYTLTEIRKKMASKERIIIAARLLLVVFGMILTLVGCICVDVALYSRTAYAVGNFQTAGLATGITGLLFLMTIALEVPLLKRYTKRKKRPNVEDKEKASEEENQELNTIESEGADNVLGAAMDGECKESLNSDQPKPSSSHSEPPEGSPAVPKPQMPPPAPPKSPKPKITTLPNPGSGKVTSMVSNCDNRIYLTTLSHIHHLDTGQTGEGDDPYNLCYTSNSAEELLMMTLHRDGILTAVVKKQYKKDQSRKHPTILIFLTKDHKIQEESQLKFTARCVLSSNQGNCLYITNPNNKHVVKTEQKGKVKSIFQVNVFGCPSYIVENSYGQLIVSDSLKNDVFVIEKNGNFLTSVRIGMPWKLWGEMYGCNRLAVGPDDRLYVSSTYSRNVLVFSSCFSYEGLISTGSESTGNVSSLMVHGSSLYVAHEGCIRIYPLDSHCIPRDNR